MGADWPDYIAEANRCLTRNGYLMIAETTRTLKQGERLETLRDVLCKQDFEIYTEENRGDFTFLEARKVN
jgi:hypothetical protein